MPSLNNDNALSARDRLIEAAAKLFYRDGVAATGIDTITREAGVAKQSLYNNFSSKAELVATYLEVRHAEWLGLYAARLADAKTPIDGILAVFDAYEDHAEMAYAHGFRGCGLLNAAAELPAGDVGRSVVRRHKEEVEGLIAGHLRELVSDKDRADQVSRQLSYLLEGAMSRAGLAGDGACIRDARMMANMMLAGLA